MSIEFRFFFAFFLLAACLFGTLFYGIGLALSGEPGYAFLCVLAAIAQSAFLPRLVAWLTMLGYKEVH